MAIYKMVGNKERLDKVAPTSFGQEGVFERSDLQRILRDQPEVLEEGLFIITEEFSNWEGSGRSIDLLGLDANGCLVVIEIKRGETGEHMDLQAIRYAAMVSTMTLQQAIDAHQAYLIRRDIDEDAGSRLAEHLENSDVARFSSENPRIFLVSEGFSPELTTCALWLNNRNLDVTCIRMQPHRSGTELFIETSQIFPLPEAHDYLVKVKTREEEQNKERQQIMRYYFRGGDNFADRVDNAEEGNKKKLRRLYEWAIGLEREMLAFLQTYIKNDICNLLVGLPTGNNPSLVSVIMNQSVLRFHPHKLEQYSPQSAQRLQELLGQQILGRKSPFNIKLENIMDDYLPTLTETYREANDLLAENSSDGE